MLSKTRGAPFRSTAPEGVPDARSGARPDASTAETAPEPTLAPRPADTDRETRRDRSRRKAHRSRLHGYAILTVAVVAFLIALAASNTADVKVNWVFGSSRVSLVWLVLFAAILGWGLGLLLTATFHWRTRAPRRGGVPS
jgi:uncharacterized integral membrane protein